VASKYFDWVIMGIAALAVLYMIYRMLYRWLHHTPGTRTRLLLTADTEPVDAEDEGVQLIEERGYTVTHGKLKVPITITIDEEEHLYSRLFVDMIAYREGEYYVVLRARERRPIDWTGSGVRDQLLVYSLLIPECRGLLYLDMGAATLYEIEFTLFD
jgi:hypothetical protein